MEYYIPIQIKTNRVLYLMMWKIYKISCLEENNIYKSL